MVTVVLPPPVPAPWTHHLVCPGAVTQVVLVLAHLPLPSAWATFCPVRSPLPPHPLSCRGATPT